MSKDIPQEVLDALSQAPEPFTSTEQAALERLIKIAKSDTGQSRKVADFLLAWWNPARCGGFDLTDVWGVDAGIAQDMMVIFGFLTRRSQYPDNLDGRTYEADFIEIVSRWHPKFKEGSE